MKTYTYRLSNGDYEKLEAMRYVVDGVSQHGMAITFIGGERYHGGEYNICSVTWVRNVEEYNEPAPLPSPVRNPVWKQPKTPIRKNPGRIENESDST